MSDLHVRWMIGQDMQDCLQIERQSFEFPWTEAEFIQFLRQRNAIAMVAVRNDEIVGFMCYELTKSGIVVEDFAVSLVHRETGVGTAMVDKLKHKLNPKRKRITLNIRETNLDGQLFFKSRGFRAVSVLHDYYEDTDDDAYVFQYRMPLIANETSPPSQAEAGR